METYQIEGRNPVKEALSGGRSIDKLFVLKGGDARLGSIIRLAKEKKLVVSEVDRRKLDEMSRSGAHQGIIAVCAAVNYVSVDDILENARQKGEKPLIVILDSITDPHNLGAIIRSAAACGAHGVIIPKHRSAGINETVEKASAGTVSLIKIAKAVNLSSTVEYLKQQGVWIFGTALEENSRAHFNCDLKDSAALIIGSEGSGMSRVLKEKCDFLVKIPMSPQVQSLNASVAAGIVLFEAAKQREAFIDG